MPDLSNFMDQNYMCRDVDAFVWQQKRRLESIIHTIR